MCEVDYDGHAEFQSTDYPVAKKLARCTECDEVIVPGQRYRYDVQKFDGQICQYKTCLRCENLRDWLGHQMKLKNVDENGYLDDCDAWLWGELGNAIGEAFHWKPPPAPPAFLDDHLVMFLQATFCDVFDPEPTYAASHP